MSVAFDASASVTGGDSGPGNHGWGGSITIGTLTNGILVCVLNGYSGNGAVTNVRLDDSSGASFTQVGTGQTFGATDNLQIFYLLNPPSGAHSIYVEAGYSMGSAILASFSGVDQTTPFTSNTNTYPPSLTVASGGAIIDGWGATDNESIPVADGTQTTLFTGIDSPSGGTYVSASFKMTSGAGQSMTWTNVSGAYEAAVLAAASGGGSPSVALSGTVTASITEADIVAGGKTIVLTLSNTTWTPS